MSRLRLVTMSGKPATGAAPKGKDAQPKGTNAEPKKPTAIETADSKQPVRSVQSENIWAYWDELVRSESRVPAAEAAPAAEAVLETAEATEPPEPRTEIEVHLERGRELLASVAAFLQNAKVEAATLRLDAARDMRGLIAGRHRAVALSFLFGATNVEAQEAAMTEEETRAIALIAQLSAHCQRMCPKRRARMDAAAEEVRTTLSSRNAADLALALQRLVATGALPGCGCKTYDERRACMWTAVLT